MLVPVNDPRQGHCERRTEVRVDHAPEGLHHVRESDADHELPARLEVKGEHSHPVELIDEEGLHELYRALVAEAVPRKE